jgi:hypothetical protein
MIRRRNCATRAGLTSGLAVLLAVTAGCGPREGRVTGRVLLDGQPVPGGTLMFMTADLKGQSIATAVDESGNYSVALPAVEVVASFDNRQFAPLPPRGPTPLPKGLSPEIRSKLGRTSAPPPPPPPAETPVGTKSGRYVKIPERYYMIETAEIKFTVKPGEYQHDIELSSKP